MKNYSTMQIALTARHIKENRLWAWFSSCAQFSFYASSSCFTALRSSAQTLSIFLPFTRQLSSTYSSVSSASLLGHSLSWWH